MYKILLLLFIIPIGISAQNKLHNPSDYFLYALNSNEKITVDGEANEDVWQKAVKIGDFWEKYPNARDKSTIKTEVRSAFDETFLYFFIECYDSTNNYVATSLKRDGSLTQNDGFTIILDPVNKKTNGFGFACTPNNVQSEYQFGHNTDALSFAWDNKWYSATKRLNDKYVIEVAIPFKTLRYNSYNTTWGINFVRSDRKKNEFSSWTNIPVQFQAIDLGYLGILQFEGDLVKQKSNISLIPYMISNVHSDAENKIPNKFQANAGFDAKVAVTASLNLDLTVNPDFSQVEVDQQVTNLTRFSVLFPERRTFFLENSDIFERFGAPPFRPFFSRSIGLDKHAHPLPILYGARLSGNLTEKTRIGVMNLQTRKNDNHSGQNYTATAIHRQFGARSVISGYFHNRSATDLRSTENGNHLDLYGRNAGAELNLIDKPGANKLWLGYHTSMKQGISSKNNFYQLGYSYSGNLYEGLIDYDNFGKNYYADMGFINRLETFAQVGNTYNHTDTTYRAGFKQLYNTNNFTIRPKDTNIISLVFGLKNYMVWFDDGGLSDKTHTISGLINFRNTSSLGVEFNIQEDNLKYYFPLPENMPLAPGNYTYNNVAVNYMGDSRKNFIINGGFKVGQFFNADLHQYSLSVLL